MGIGTLLLGSGIERARAQGLSMGTEASVKGLGLYRKMGFTQVGVWSIAKFKLPVMKLAAS
jgi:GNAT superfamily N-acetyltransferase